MPFDSTTRIAATEKKLARCRTLAEACADLGITPIPLGELEQYKQEALPKARRLAPAHYRSFVRWIEFSYSAYEHHSIAYGGKGDYPAIPYDVAALGAAVMKRTPAATERVIGYIYTDPYLVLRHAGESDVCLGIWDNSGTVRLAGAAPPARKSVAARIRSAVKRAKSGG